MQLHKFFLPVFYVQIVLFSYEFITKTSQESNGV